MRDEIFKSMKNQMMPSDDCVNDLLAKIAALDASQVEAPADNVLQFEPKVIDFKATKNRVPRKTWGFATAAVAAAVCLVSVFGTMGDSPEDITAQIGDIVDNPTVIVDNNSNTEEIITATHENEETAVEDNEAALSDGEKKPGKLGQLFKKETKDTNDKAEGTSEDSDSKNESSTAGNNNSNGNSNSNAIENIVVEDTKIAPSEAATNELTWTKEILADSSVKEIVVEGSNYVVDSSVASIATGSQIQTISLSVPETETTQADTVKANALKVSNVSTDLAVAIDVKEYDGKLIYLNSDYNPETLGQFIKDAGIENGTAFSSVVYTGERIGYSSGTKIKKNIESAVVKDLFVAEATRAKSSLYNSGTEKIVFTSAHNPTGTKISFGVSSNGYLKVILSNGNTYTFEIGAENANAFIDYALS